MRNTYGNTMKARGWFRKAGVMEAIRAGYLGLPWEEQRNPTAALRYEQGRLVGIELRSVLAEPPKLTKAHMPYLTAAVVSAGIARMRSGRHQAPDPALDVPSDWRRAQPRPALV